MHPKMLKTASLAEVEARVVVVEDKWEHTYTTMQAEGGFDEGT